MRYILSCLLLLVYLTIQNNATETYTTQYDGIDLEEILANDRLLSGYVKCLLELGPCTPDGKELKKNLPDAIENDCKKCSDKQRDGADRVMHYIIDNRPDDWKKLEEKYNSDGSYKVKYLANKHSEEDKPTNASKSSKDSNNEPDE